MNKVQIIKYLIFTLLFCTYTQQGYPQSLNELATPCIKNYDRRTYNASTQNWAICLDQNHILWFGNKGYVLHYNGFQWGKVGIPNGSIVRSLANADSVVLAGSFGDFGAINSTKTGDYKYQSWLNQIPENKRDFAEIWKIHSTHNSIYFQSYKYVFIFTNGKFIDYISPPEQFKFSFLNKGKLYIQDSKKGLMTIVDNQLNQVQGGDFFTHKEIWHISDNMGDLMVFTQNEGAYIFRNSTWERWNNEANDYLIANKLFSAVQRENLNYYFGTVNGGVISADLNGRIKKKIDKQDGLQNNTVLSIFEDKDMGLWLGLDIGIDYINVNYPFKTLHKESGFGTGYAAIEHKGNLYLGTNQGVFTWSEETKDFMLIPNSTGQVWSLQIINGELYCFHNNGILQITQTNSELAYKMDGAWKAEEIPSQPGRFIVGNYNGLHLVDFNTWQVNKLSNFNESSRVFVFDKQEYLWISHGFKGVYRIKLSDDYSSVDNTTYFGKNQGLPSNLNNEVFKFKDEIIIGAEDGFYQYNDVIGLMQKHQKWNELFNFQHPITKIQSDTYQRFFFFTRTKLIWTLLEEDSISYIDSTSFLPLSNDFFRAFENIYFTKENKAILGTVDGFCVYDREHYQSLDTNIPLQISKLLFYDSKIQELEQQIINQDYIKLPYAKRNLSIELSMPYYLNCDNTQILYTINSNKQSVSQKTNILSNIELHRGINEISILAKDLTLNKTSDQITLKVRVLAPTYAKWYAILSYVILLSVLLYVGLKIYRKKIEFVRRKEKIKEARKAMRKQQALKKQAEDAEKELMKMRNDKLRSENRQKSEEIANSTMELVQKNKMLLAVKDTLKDIQKETNIDIRNSRIRSMLKKIDRDLNNEENWKVFEKNFDEVHENFLNRLKELHPELTSKDLRLCAYLKMNLSSKEIAPLLRISSRSVEISRYRLRKKMDLNRNTNLSDHIHSV